MKILIVGLGALGTVFATALKSSGEIVFGLTKGKYINSFKDRKTKMIGLFGNKEALLDGIFSSVEEISSEAFDLIIVTVKSFDTEEVIKQIAPIVKENTLVLLAQNGYGNYEIAKRCFGRERVILSRIIFGARLIEIGYAEVTVFGDQIVIGQPEEAVSEDKLAHISEIFNKAGLPTRVSKDVYKILWDKILYNCALNPLGALLECPYGDLAKDEYSREIMNGIIDEIFSVAKAHQIELNWNNPEQYRRHFYEKLVPPTAKHFPSMFYDLKGGKRTEIDALNGAIVNLGSEKNIDTPINKTIVNLIKAKERLNLSQRVDSN